MKKFFRTSFVAFGCCLFTAVLYANQVVITKISGTVETLLAGKTDWTAAALTNILKDGDKLRTGANSTVELVTIQGHTLKLLANSEMSVEKLAVDNSKLKLINGGVKTKVNALKSGEAFETQTPNATCAVRGTEYKLLYVEKDKLSQVSVDDGNVSFLNALGREVIVRRGQFSQVRGENDPSAPQEIPQKGDAGSSVAERMAKAKQEIFYEISKQQVLNQAAEDMKKAEYQNGKALVDAYGKRVRLEEYIMRPAADQFKYVVLNERDDRFDFGKMLFTFNKDLPIDLTDATQTMFHKEGEAPEWYPTDVLSVMSNTLDSVTEEASGGHPVANRSGSSTYYDTTFDKYYFYANNTMLWGYDNISVPSTQYNIGGQDPVSTWTQPDGGTVFHFIAKDVYADGTWIQAEDFVVRDDGKVADFGDIIDPANLTADGIRDKVLQLNFERVYTSSLFGDRTIDLVFSSKLLSDAGIINLPTSLSAPAAIAQRSFAGAEPTLTQPVLLAKFNENNSDETFPIAEKPFPDTTKPDTAQPQKNGRINQVVSAELLGGQYFVEGEKTSLKGNASLLYVPLINLSDANSILPIYSGQYRGTKDVHELIGGGTLVQREMDHSLYVKGIHKNASNASYKGTIGYTGQWLAETVDETLQDGLFNNRRYSAGVEVEKPFAAFTGTLGYDFGMTEYYNYQALSSDSRFADAGVTSSMGTDVLNYNSHDLLLGIAKPISETTSVNADYRLSYLTFGDQNIIKQSGEYGSSSRKDLAHTANIEGIVRTKATRLSLGYGIKYYNSNQNAYDANRTYFTKDYYDYVEQKITPSVSFSLGKTAASSLSLYWDFSFLKYLDRKVQNAQGDYGANKVGQVSNGFGVWVNYPLYKQLAFKVKMDYLMSTSNMKYEKSYVYNYDVVNYFFGFGWEL